jgi:hypothetical protein
MSKKHNTKHASRSLSNYGKRLEKRGESSASVRMDNPLLSDGKRADAKR